MPGGAAGISNSNNTNVGINVNTPGAKLDIKTDEIIGALQLRTTEGGNGMSSNPPGVGVSPYAFQVIHDDYNDALATWQAYTSTSLSATGVLTLGNMAGINTVNQLNLPSKGVGVYQNANDNIVLAYLSIPGFNGPALNYTGTIKNFSLAYNGQAVIQITPNKKVLVGAGTGTANTEFAFTINSGLGSIFRVADGGSVYIGENLNGNFFEEYRLYVEKGIRAERVRVDIAADNGWADFVFEDDYTLMPVAELEGFIKKYKHLPNVPSAAQVQAEGIDLAEMNAILLRQIEELTLRVISLEKQISQ